MASLWAKIKHWALIIGALFVVVAFSYLIGISVGHMMFVPMLAMIGLIATSVANPVVQGLLMVLAGIILGYVYYWLSFKLLGNIYRKSVDKVNTAATQYFTTFRKPLVIPTN